MRSLALALLITSSGCIDGFKGSNVQFDFSKDTPVQASVGVAPMDGELPDNIHFTLYAFEEDSMAGRLFEIQRFEIHRIVDLVSPCFIDVGEHTPHPGLHVTQYATVIGQDTGVTDIMNPPAGATEEQKIDAATAVQREDNVLLLAGDRGMRVISGASQGKYPAVGTSCTDPNGIPPPTCTDPDSNARRLAMCEAAWHADPATGAPGPDYFEGTDRVLTQPLNGTTHGMVDGVNPINSAPVGGAQFFVDEVLDNFQGYGVYWQFDDANGDGMPDYPASFPMADRSTIGQLLVFGKPTMATRGVIHVHMTSALQPKVFADLAIFSDLASDNVQF